MRYERLDARETENGVGGEAQMKFFLPVQEAKTAEESYQAIKKFIEKQTGWPISTRAITRSITAAMTRTCTLASEGQIR
jgi:hypothetical protein